MNGGINDKMVFSTETFSDEALRMEQSKGMKHILMSLSVKIKSGP